MISSDAKSHFCTTERASDCAVKAPMSLDIIQTSRNISLRQSERRIIVFHSGPDVETERHLNRILGDEVFAPLNCPGKLHFVPGADLSPSIGARDGQNKARENVCLPRREETKTRLIFQRWHTLGHLSEEDLCLRNVNATTFLESLSVERTSKEPIPCLLCPARDTANGGFYAHRPLRFF